jgi:hypothetical protein
LTSWRISQGTLLNLFSIILRERGIEKSFKFWFTWEKRLNQFAWGFLGDTDGADANGDGIGGVGLCGRVRKLAEMGWNPEPMIQIFVEMPDTWKVVIAMNGD